MSGIEVAGLVLAAYPILSLVCNQYKNVFHELAEWRSFRHRFEDFAIDLDTERLCFRDTLKSLLCLGPSPFVQSFEEAEIILNDPSHEAWRNQELLENLELRLGDKYSTVAAIINKLNNTVPELYRLLDIERGQVALKEKQSWRWREEKLLRLKFTFSTKRFEKMAQVKTLNENLERLVRTNDQFERLKTSAYPSSLITVLMRVRENACGLHKAVRSAWTCKCSKKHAVQLRLEKRGEGREPPFFLRCYGANTKRRDMEVHITPVSASETARTPSPSSRTISFAVSNSDSPNSRDLPCRVKGSHSVSTIIYEQTETDMMSIRRTFFNLRKKQKADSDMTHGSPSTDLSASTPTVLLEAGDNEHRSQKQSQKRIIDLCHSICTSWGPEEVYLCEGEKEYKLLEMKDKDEDKAMTLQALLIKRSLKRSQRIKIASILASSLLQLQKTPWSTNGWCKNDIWIFEAEDGKVSATPFVTRTFEPSTSALTDTKAISSASSSKDNSPFETPLIQFGILLLELCFGETIESRVHRSEWDINENKDRLPLVKYTAALEWSIEVEDEFPGLKILVDRCLKESFGERLDWNNTQFLARLHANLAAPLSNILVQNGWDNV